MFVVYERPADHPEHFVCREWLVLNGQAVATATFWMAKTLREVRARIPRWCKRIERAPVDDPKVLETWL